MSTEVLFVPPAKHEVLPAFAIAFQPIVDAANRTVVAYEALTRGVASGVTYPDLIEDMDDAARRRFQHATVERMIERATALGLQETGASLCINISPEIEPGSVSAESIGRIATQFKLPTNRIVLELTEDYKVKPDVLRELLSQNEAAGFATAMDDFGGGYAGLTMLTECRPQILKLDRALVQGIDHCDTRQKLVGAFSRVCRSLGMMVVAEGIETRAEYVQLRRLGITLMQGYLFARPTVDALPQPDWAAVFKDRKKNEFLRRINPWTASEALTLPA